MKKIVIVSSYDPSTTKAWSGTPHFCSLTLSRSAKKTIFAAPLEPFSTTHFLRTAARYRNAGRVYFRDRDATLIKERARTANEVLRSHNDADAVFVFHPPDAAFLETRIPIIILHDATFKQFIEDYGYDSSIAHENYESGCVLERLGFENARQVVFFTKWAADRALCDYPNLRDKFHVIPPGANLANPPTRDAVKEMIERRVSGPCRLLLVGVDSQRKGVQIAVDACSALRSRGLDVNIQVVGVPRTRLADRPRPLETTLNMTKELSVTPPECNPFATTYGFLQKDDQEELALLQELFACASFLILPTRADCSPIALCEAAAFGLPAITSAVGGICELVIDGETGITIDKDAGADIYANAILSNFTQKSKYRSLAASSRERFESMLNWPCFVERVCELI